MKDRRKRPHWQIPGWFRGKMIEERFRRMARDKKYRREGCSASQVTSVEVSAA